MKLRGIALGLGLAACVGLAGAAALSADAGGGDCDIPCRLTNIEAAQGGWPGGDIGVWEWASDQHRWSRGVDRRVRDIEIQRRTERREADDLRTRVAELEPPTPPFARPPRVVWTPANAGEPVGLERGEYCLVASTEGPATGWVGALRSIEYQDILGVTPSGATEDGSPFVSSVSVSATPGGYRLHFLPGEDVPGSGVQYTPDEGWSVRLDFGGCDPR